MNDDEYQKKIFDPFNKKEVKLSNKMYADKEHLAKIEEREKWEREHPDGEPMPISEIFTFNQLKEMNTLKKKDYMEEILN